MINKHDKDYKDLKETIVRTITKIKKSETISSGQIDNLVDDVLIKLINFIFSKDI